MELYKNRSVGILTISQRDYMKKVLKRFNMDAAKVVNTQIQAHSNFLLICHQKQKKKCKIWLIYHMLMA